MEDRTSRITKEIELRPRQWGGWMALLRDRPLAASGATASEAQARLEKTVERFEAWGAQAELARGGR
jgi:hypothetical protein